jgi:ABC-type dipeptide/oligopeptide/nickel transport system permease component
LCGMFAAYRTRSLRASVATGLVVSLFAAPITLGGILLMLAIWHEPQTMSAIAHSGGLHEVFSLPIFMGIPAIILALVGGLFGKAAASIFS